MGDCQGCHEPQAVTVAGGYLDQGVLNDIGNFANFCVFPPLMDEYVAEVTFAELLPRSWSTHDLDLWEACQACHEPQAVAVAGGY